MKKFKIVILCIALSSIFTGCLFKTGDELLQAPKPSTDYIALQNKLDIELTNGGVYASAESGSNRATIQLYDIDADAEEEAIAFFRQSALSGTFNVVVYKKIGEEYIDTGRVIGHGTAIDEVAYPKLSSIGAGGIAVSWRISNQIEKGLTVAKFENGKLEIVLDTQYTSYFIYDIDYDGLDEIFIINSENERKVLNMYKMINGKMDLVSTVALSAEIENIARITTGELYSGGRAVAIDSRISLEVGLITDIIALSYEGELLNLSINPEDLSGMSTYRAISSYSSKLNTENYLYVPTILPMIGYFSDLANTTNWISMWSMYDIFNDVKSDIYTYHNNAEGWYYVLSQSQIANITATRVTASNIKITKFQYCDGFEYEDLFEIYTIPLDDYASSQFPEEYIQLGKTTANVYLAKNLNPQNFVKITDEQILENFNIISSSN